MATTYWLYGSREGREGQVQLVECFVERGGEFSVRGVSEERGRMLRCARWCRGPEDSCEARVETLTVVIEIKPTLVSAGKGPREELLEGVFRPNHRFICLSACLGVLKQP